MSSPSVSTPGAMSGSCLSASTVENLTGAGTFSAQCLAAIREENELVGLSAVVGKVLQPVLALAVPSDCPPMDEIPEYKVTR